ncbi:hypothetical protein M877_36910 [Streptomyces niveus NCIMB 11891]|nr:hypothetical protein M877_36910 [Streptomyces niveus NCIMB 11891]
MSRVLGVDSGGSGLRIALGSTDGDGAVRTLGTAVSTEPVRTGPSGIDPDHLLEQLLPAVRTLLARADGTEAPVAVAIGAAGMATLGDGLRAGLPAALESALGYGGWRSPPTRSPRTRGRSASVRAPSWPRVRE